MGYNIPSSVFLNKERKNVMFSYIKKQSPGRIIALGFALTILIGSFLLMMPLSIKDGASVGYIDALYTSTSAVCVTGLVTVDIGDTFTSLGQLIIAVLIQIGGLGVAAIGTGVILLLGKKINIKGRNIIRESMNVNSAKGLVSFIQDIFVTTLIIELVGAILSFFVFIKDYPPIKAVGISLFHSVAAFNNSGFDIFGGMKSLTGYADNVLLNIVTAALIFFGGLGFLVIKELLNKKFRWKKLSMHARVIISMSIALIIFGTLLFKLTEEITWLGAFFQSVSARTAGFASYNMSGFTNAGLMVMIVLMFIGASPGSTGGGIKTSTFFVLLQGIKTAATNRSQKAFHYSLPKDAFRKASVVALLALGIIITCTYLMLVMEHGISFMDALFEVTSAFGTVGLSTGITPTLSVGSKILTIIIMFIGRLGPLTIATLVHFSKEERVSYPEGNIAIG